MEEHLHMPDPATFGRRVDYGFQEAAGQLGEYFAGQRRRLTLRMRPEGSDFQRRVWQVVGRDPVRADSDLRAAGRGRRAT